jgi:hypothetical protein
MTDKPRHFSSHEIVSLSVTPAVAALLLWGLSRVMHGSAWFAPPLTVGVALIAGYLVLLFIAFPLYAWVKTKFGVRWLTVLVSGAVCGAAIPFAIHALILSDALLSGHFHSVTVILGQAFGATCIGVAYGLLMAIIFKLLVGRSV